MIALDTNLLVYAHREDSPHHVSALDLLGDLARGRRDWAIPWPCLHEFLAVVTHPRIYVPPTSADSAVAAVEALVATPRLRLLGEGQDHLRQLAALLASGQITGPRVHDARIATFGARAEDLLLVSDEHNHPLAPGRRDALRDALLAALDGEQR